ncbi:MAG: DUF6880 family protein [Hyphomicrobiaceae bacterium]
MRHLPEIESQHSDIDDYGRLESHVEFVARLKREQSRMAGFWSALAAECRLSRALCSGWQTCACMSGSHSE